ALAIRPAAGVRPTNRRASPPSVSRRRRVALLWRRARSLMPPPGRGLARGDTLARPETRQRVRDCYPHLRLVPVVLGGRPETSACSSPGEPTTSKPWRPRMFRTPEVYPRGNVLRPPRQVVVDGARRQTGGAVDDADVIARSLVDPSA